MLITRITNVDGLHVQLRTFRARTSHYSINEALQLVHIALAAAGESLGKVVHRDAVNTSNRLQRVGSNEYSRPPKRDRA
jgi:hypothetical protein